MQADTRQAFSKSLQNSLSKYSRKLPQLIYKEQSKISSLPLLLNNLQSHLRERRKTGSKKLEQKIQIKYRTLETDCQLLLSSILEDKSQRKDKTKQKEVNKIQGNLYQWKEKYNNSINKYIFKRTDSKNGSYTIANRQDHNQFVVCAHSKKVLQPISRRKCHSQANNKLNIHTIKFINLNNLRLNQEIRSTKQSARKIETDTNEIILQQRANTQTNNSIFEEMLDSRRRGKIKNLKLLNISKKIQLNCNERLDNCRNRLSTTKLTPWKLQHKDQSDDEENQMRK